MPRRNTPLVNDNFYHVYNRGVNKQPIFFTLKNYKRAVETIKYYLVENPPIRYSKFLQLTNDKQREVSENLNNAKRTVEVISYTLMPNHYHFLLKQVSENGIKNFIRNFQISYTKYINTRFDRVGPLFQGQFKAKLIEDIEILNHLDRYIHLNAYTSHIVKTIEELKVYYPSSLPDYLGAYKGGFCSKEFILMQYSSINKYWEFIVNQAGYQKNLEQIKHITFE